MPTNLLQEQRKPRNLLSGSGPVNLLRERKPVNLLAQQDTADQALSELGLVDRSANDPLGIGIPESEYSNANFQQTVKEAPSAAVRGVVNLLEHTLNIPADVANLVGERVANSPEAQAFFAKNPAVPVELRQQAQGPDVLTEGQPEFTPVPTVDLPKPAAPETPAGQLIETAAEFAAGLVPVGAAIRAPGRIVRAAREIGAAKTAATEAAPAIAEAATARAAGVVDDAAKPVLGPKITPSEDVVRLTDTLTEEGLNAPREIGRGLKPKDAPKAAGQRVSSLSADDAEAALQANILEKGGFEHARRTGTTWKQTQQAARELDLTIDEVVSAPIGTARNAEALEKMKGYGRDASIRLQELARLRTQAVEAGDTATIDAIRNAQLRNYTIVEKVAAARSEAGRSLNILKVSTVADRKLGKAIRNIQKSGRTLDEQLAMISTLDDPAQVARFAQDASKITTGQKIREAWINALLSGKALIVNPASNSLVSLYTPGMKAVQAGVSRIPLIGGGEPVYFREALAHMNGMRRAMHTATADALRIFATEAVPPHLINTKIEGPIQAAIGKGPKAYQQTIGRVPGFRDAGKVVRTPGRILQSQDAWFKIVNAGGEVEALAVRDAIKRGLRGDAFKAHVQKIVAEPPKDIWDKAWKAADNNTFTTPLKDQKGLLAYVSKGFQKGSADRPLSIGMFFPFVRTPTNIMKWGTANSPLGWALADVRAQIALGGAARSEAMARMAIGTAMAVTAWDMVENGFITGGGPRDPVKRSTWRLTHHPYSVRIPGTDHWMNYGRLEPLSTVFGTVADLYEVTSNLTEKERESFMGAIPMIATTVFARQVGSKTFVNGATTLAKAATGERHYVDNLVELLAGSLIPSGVAEVARTTDPVVRDVRGIVDRWQSRIPGLTENVQPLQTIWGEDITRGDPLLNLLSPVYIYPNKVDPVATEMQRLQVGPRMNTMDAIEGVELTGPQRTRFIKLAGQPAKRDLLEDVKSSWWKKMTDDEQAEHIKKTISMHRAEAKDEMLYGNDDPDTVALRQAVEAKQDERYQ